MNFSRMMEINLIKIPGYPSVEAQKEKVEKQLSDLKEAVFNEAYEYLCLWADKENLTAYQLNKDYVLLTWEKPETQYYDFYFTFYARISNRLSIESSFFKVIEIEPFLESRGYYERFKD